MDTWKRELIHDVELVLRLLLSIRTVLLNPLVIEIPSTSFGRKNGQLKKLLERPTLIMTKDIPSRRGHLFDALGINEANYRGGAEVLIVSKDQAFGIEPYRS